jgi:exopolyphosphatase/guanosine-5'-triphosphate,3'-diphosphate pyrophosphatase
MAEGMAQAGGGYAAGGAAPGGETLSLSAATSSSTTGKKPIILERNPLGTQAAKSAVEPAALPERPPETMAVIDIGANAMRLAVAQLLPGGQIEQLERATRAIRLGQDTFATGRLSQKTMSAAVAILRDYRRILDTYGVRHVRAVATSSVREASNADAFLDRLFMAANVEVEVIDPSEEIRLIVGAVRSALGAPGIHRDKSLIVDVGGGSALLAVLQKGEILASGSFPLGSVRLQEMLSTSQEPPARATELLRHQIANVIASIRSALKLKQVKFFVAVGADAQFAAQQAGLAGAASEPVTIGSREFDSFVARCEVHTADELANLYHIPFVGAERIVPACLTYQALLHETRAKSILVPSVLMQDGLLLDLVRAISGKEDPDLHASIVQSARAVGEKYRFNAEHAFHVAALSEQLFGQLQTEHGLPPRFSLLLRVAAILHEVGGFVSNRAHHKHSFYLISNSEVYGLRRDEMQIVALVARYHRRGLPDASHAEYMVLPRESRMIVSKLAAILRVADSLDRGHAQQIRDIQFERQGDEFVLYVRGVPDLSLERRALAVKADLFEEVYGMRVRLEEAQQT